MNEPSAHPEQPRLSYEEGGVVAPFGFMAGAGAGGLKPDGRRDVALIVADAAVPAAAVFTRSSMAAAPIEVSRRTIATGSARAVVANAGNANACTGEQGLRDAEEMAATAARALGCDPGEIVVASTGVIGVPLPVAQVAAAVGEAVGDLDRRDGRHAAEAIMTTDTFPKESGVSFDLDDRRIVVGGMAKGAGMIMPDMATMLAFVTTDARLSSAACDAVLREAVDATFHRITVDSDTSTNDMVMLMASGAAGGPPIEVGGSGYRSCAYAVREVCGELARMIVRDGEGATKMIGVVVRGADSQDDARAVALSVANSPLVKTAVFGGDANWGRVAMAVGKSDAKVDPWRLSIRFAGISVCDAGQAVPFDEGAAAEALAADEIEIEVGLGLGTAEYSALTCDLSYEYVRINADYRS